MLRIVYARSAAKASLRLPTRVAQAVEQRLAMLAEDPTRVDVDVKRLVGRPGLRLRVGDWRVIYEVEGETLTVLRIAPRGDVYR